MERTLTSYVIQEAEGVSRRAKLVWCKTGGHDPISLQHDGVIIRLVRDACKHDAARQLSRVCSHALGYAQAVVLKD